jgi:hypothetical protein
VVGTYSQQSVKLTLFIISMAEINWEFLHRTSVENSIPARDRF